MRLQPSKELLRTDEKGSMSFWDNRSCMHRAVVDFSPHKRVMRRVTIQGDVPYYDPHADKRVAAEAEQLSKL